MLFDGTGIREVVWMTTKARERKRERERERERESGGCIANVDIRCLYEVFESHSQNRHINL